MKEQSDSPLDRHLSYRQALWCIPILLLIHNAEEALTMPEWMNTYLPMLQEKLFLFRYVNFSTTQLYVSLFLVSITPFIISGSCSAGLGR